DCGCQPRGPARPEDRDRQGGRREADRPRGGQRADGQHQGARAGAEERGVTVTDETTAAGMTARGHALRVAVAEAVAEVAGKARKQARGEAEALFAALREDGQTQQKVVLPDGEEIGLVSIKAGGTTVEVDDEDALLAWVDEHCPGEAEEYVDPDAITN